MLQSSARLLRLLTLLQSRRFWSGLELAQRLEVTERTLRRDIDKVRSLGYPIKSSSGVAGGYELSAGSSLPPLVLEDKEALAVVLGLRMTASAGVSGLEHEAMQALLKLERLLPQRLQKQVASFNTSITSLTGGPSANSDTLLLLARATQETLRVSFSYSAVPGKTERSVDPCGLVHAGMRWYLVAWDLAREDFRTFRVDRINGDVRLTGEHAEKHLVPGGDIAAYVSKQVGAAPYPIQARLMNRCVLRSRL
jgi:predicted DNA-binding transcriptional regulator YafY